MTFGNDENIEYPPAPEFSLLKTKKLPDDMIEITPENDGSALARLWQTLDEERTAVYLEVVEPKVCVEIWKKPAETDTSWLSFFVTRFENAEDTEAFVVEKGVYQLAMDDGDADNLGPVRLELFLQP